MGKTIASPVDAFPGTVTLNDKPTLAMVENFVYARMMKRDTEARARERNAVLFDATASFVEAWNIEGQPSPLTRETLNPIPYLEAQALIGWVVSEVWVLCLGERQIPNASGPGLTDTPKTPATAASQPS